MSARSARSFFDTNVLLYTDSSDAPAKRRRALELIGEHRLARTGVVSLQVLQEYFAAATRKLGIDVDVARRKVELFANLHVVTLDVDDVLAGIDLHRLHQVSFWDALILRAAKQGGCPEVYSEDLQHGRSIDGVRIVNPFR
jgi:predicted nucleic acid-binding protein